MNTIEILFLGICLAMDAFAISICKGLAQKKCSYDKMLIVGLWFGGSQAVMPLIGYLLGEAFESIINTWSSFIAFGLLLFIGINMIREALEDEEDDCSGELGFHVMFPLAVATSIDAMASGVVLSVQNANIFLSIGIIGTVTMLLSMIGFKVGHTFGTRFKKKAAVTGGVVLCLLGIKILLEYFGLWF